MTFERGITEVWDSTGSLTSYFLQLCWLTTLVFCEVLGIISNWQLVILIILISIILEQSCPIKLSSVMEMSYICTAQYDSH
jgi:hypothetical protein